MDVVYFGSREIYGDFKTAINSLRAHNLKTRVYAIIEDDKLDIPKVKYIKWDAHKYFNDTNLHTQWRQFGPIRTAFTKIFPDKDRIISIDCDTIVQDDISELWTMDLTDYHVAMTPEITSNRTYHNNGICVMNLKKLREDGVDDLMIAEMNRNHHIYVGQDAMQMYCKILDLPSTYNASMFTAPVEKPKILHFANRTDWRGYPEVIPYR